jgi:hypothetical protein
MGLAGCAGDAAAANDSPQNVFQHGRVVAAWSLDQGQLSIEPAQSTPEVPGSQAAAVFAASELGATMPERVFWGWGRVTIDPKITDDGTPRFRHRDAWIAVASGLATGCPAMVVPESPSSRPQPDYHALVLDGQTGTAGVLYDSGQPMCGGPVQSPHAWTLVETVSMPWTLLHQTNDGAVVTAQVPVCAQDVVPQGRGNDATTVEEWQVLAHYPMTESDCQAQPPEPTQVQIDFLTTHTLTLAHGPVGPVPPPAADTTGGRIERLAGLATDTPEAG